jgi:hypothetical protein
LAASEVVRIDPIENATLGRLHDRMGPEPIEIQVA